MAIVRNKFKPTLSLPMPVVTPSRGPRMLQQSYNEPKQIKQRHLDKRLPEDQSIDEQDNLQQEQQIPTGDFVNEQLYALQERPIRPELQPSARIQNPSESLVDPTNFRSYFNMLNSISNLGKEALGAEQARSQHRYIQALQKIMSRRVPGFQGVQLDSSGMRRRGGGSGSVPSNPRRNFRFAQQVAPRYGWGQNELGAWYTLGMKESGWRSNAQNPSSTAYGIGQFLDKTWGAYGFRKSSNPAYQVNAMASYIKSRYGSPSRALAFHRRNNYY